MTYGHPLSVISVFIDLGAFSLMEIGAAAVIVTAISRSGIAVSVCISVTVSVISVRVAAVLTVAASLDCADDQIDRNTGEMSATSSVMTYCIGMVFPKTASISATTTTIGISVLSVKERSASFTVASVRERSERLVR